MPQAKNKNHNQAEAKSKSKLPPSAHPATSSSVPAPQPLSSDQQNSATSTVGRSQLVQQGVVGEKIRLQQSKDHQKPQQIQNSLLEQEQSQIQVVRQDLVLDDDEPSEVSNF